MVCGFLAKFMMIKRAAQARDARRLHWTGPRRLRSLVAASADKLDYDFTLARDDVKDRNDY